VSTATYPQINATHSVEARLIRLFSAVFGRCYNATAVEQQLAHSYAPVTVDCPCDVEWIRPATGLNPKEAEWVANRKKVVAFALGDYLERLGMEDFDVGDYLVRLVEEDYASVPIIGFAISGGGWASALTGTGAMRALDSRLEAAREQRVGGLLQSMTYMSGLSGGSWPIISFATNNFPTADEILQDWQPQISRLLVENDTQYAASSRSVFEDMGAKAEAGFNVSFSDYLGRALAYEYIPGPHGGLNVTMSSISTLSNFVNHQMPLPLLQGASIVDSNVEYYGLKVPFENSTVVS
jgi:lysophospholipase